MARTRQKSRQHWPNIRAGLASLTLVVAFSLVAWQWSALLVRFDALLPIRHVRIEGEFANLDPEALDEVLRPLVQGNYFRVDLAAVEQAAASLSWVRSAQVARVWPDTLALSITEQNPVARWGDHSLISDAGVVFPVASAVADYPSYSGLPALNGPVGHETEVLSTLAGLNQKFSVRGTPVLWLELSDRLAWTAGLSDGLEIVYGNSEPLPATERLLAWLPSLGEHRAGALRRLDLRYPRGFAVTFKPQLTVPAESQPTPKAG